jgi:secondary thiamine-phosphate synthase enzyme
MTVSTGHKRQIIDITDLVQKELKGSGLVNVFVKHTTCAVTTADLDPATDQDYLAALEKMTPNENWQHPHDPGHFPDHLWAAIIGPEVTIPFKDGNLALGSWQRIILVELDGPRERVLEITAIAG